MMEYLLLLSRTSLSLPLLMEPPQSPKFNMPLWQPWIAPAHKGIYINFLLIATSFVIFLVNSLQTKTNSIYISLDYNSI